MNCFGRKPSSYASDAVNHKPVGLFDCASCGASVTENFKTKHEEWHDVQDQRIKDLESRPPVVINNTPYVQPSTYPYYPSYPIYNPPTYTPTIVWHSGTLGGNISGNSTTYSNLSAGAGFNSGNFYVDGISNNDDEDGEAGSLV